MAQNCCEQGGSRTSRETVDRRSAAKTSRQARRPKGTSEVHRGEVANARSLRHQYLPLGIPDLEASDVELNALLVTERRGDALDYHLLPRDGLVARIAHLTVGWTTIQSVDAIERQATVPELLADEGTDDFAHWPTIVASGAPHPRGRSTRHATEPAS